MKLVAWFVGVLALLAATVVGAQHTNFSFPATTSSGATVGVGSAVINWSLLGIVADGVTDNTAALAALPQNVTIVGDCPTGGSVRFSQWLLKSNQTFRLQQTCPMVSTLTSPSNGSGRLGVISQVDPTTPITNVSIDGLYMARVAIPPTQATGAGCTGALPYYCGYMMYLNVDHFTLTNFHFDTYNGGIFMTGSDVEIGYGLGTNNSHGSEGNGCVTYMATHPGVSSTGNKPINPFTGVPVSVWVHGLGTAAQPFGSADGCFQLAPQLVGNVGSGTADSILFEDSFVRSDGPCFLIGSGSRVITVPIGGNITNFVFRNIQGRCDNLAILASAGLMPHLGFEHGLIQNVTFDNSFDVTSPQAILINVPSSLSPCSSGPNCGPNGLFADGHITDLTLSDVTIHGTYGRALYIYGTGTGSPDAGIKSVTVKGLVSDAQRSGVRQAIQVKGIAPDGWVNINNYNVVAGTAGVVFDARNSGTPVNLSNGIITNVPLNNTCIVLQAVDSGTVSGNVCQPATGVTAANGIFMTNYALGSATVASCGAGGYVAGDTVNIGGGTQSGGVGQVDINAVDGSGCPTVMAVSVGGGYSVFPTSPATTSGATGTGLTLNVLSRNGTSNSVITGNNLLAMPALNRVICAVSTLNNQVFGNLGASDCAGGVALWSTLGIVDDGVTDNTAALDALPANTNIRGDCPTTGQINFFQFFLKNNLTVNVDPSCILYSTYTVNSTVGTQITGAVTQHDITTPVQNIKLTGGTWKRAAKTQTQTTGAGCTAPLNPLPSYCGQIVFAYVNHFTMTDFTFDTYNAGFMIQGADIEIGRCSSRNAASGSQANGFVRYTAGASPAIPVNPSHNINPLTGIPASLWVHDCGSAANPVQSGDGVLQISPNFAAANGTVGFGVGSTDNALFENIYAQGLSSSCILVGTTNSHNLNSYGSFTITNAMFRQIHCKGGVLGATFINGTNPGQHWANIVLQDSDFDQTLDTTATGGAILVNSATSHTTCKAGWPAAVCCNGLVCNGVIDGFTLKNVTINNLYQRALFIVGDITGLTIDTVTTSLPSSALARWGVQISLLNGTDSNASIVNSNFASGTAGGINVSLANTTATTPSIINNTISNISSGHVGLQLEQFNNGTVTGNTFTGAVGGGAKGIVPTAYSLLSASVNSCGAGGYQVDDTLVPVGGTATNAGAINVDEVDVNGCPTAIDVSDNGSYTAPVPSPTTVTGGSGSGLVLNITNRNGTTNTIITGNTLTDPNISTPIVCTTIALGNFVTGNAGATDCATFLTGLGLALAWTPISGVTATSGNITAVAPAFGTTVPLAATSPNQPQLLTNQGPSNQSIFSFSNPQFASWAGTTFTGQFTVSAVLTYNGTGSQHILSHSANPNDYLEIWNTGAGGIFRNIIGGGLFTQAMTFANNAHLGLMPQVVTFVIDLVGHTGQAYLDGVPGPLITDANFIGPVTFDQIGGSFAGYQGYVGPILVFNTALAASDVANTVAVLRTWHPPTIYAGAAGNDTTRLPWLNTGSNPFQTLPIAMDYLIAGQTLALKCDEIFRVAATYATRAVSANSGTPTAPITIDGHAWCPSGVGLDPLPDGTKGPSIRASIAPAPTLVSGTIYDMGDVGSDAPGWLTTATTVVTAGTGYNNGDTITMAGCTNPNPAPFGTVTTDGAGHVTSIHVTDSGLCDVYPSNPVSFTGGAGTGLKASAEFGCGGGTHKYCMPASLCSHVVATGVSTNNACGYVYYKSGTAVTFSNDPTIPGPNPSLATGCPWCKSNTTRLVRDYFAAPNAPAVGKYGYDETTRHAYVNVGVALNAGDIEIPRTYELATRLQTFPSAGVLADNYWMIKNVFIGFNGFTGWDCNGTINCDQQNITTAFTASDGIDGHNLAVMHTTGHLAAFNGRWPKGVNNPSGVPTPNIAYGNAYSLHDGTQGFTSNMISIYNDQDAYGHASGVVWTMDRGYAVDEQPVFMNNDDCFSNGVVGPGPGGTCPNGSGTVTNSVLVVPSMLRNPDFPTPTSFTDGIQSHTSNGGKINAYGNTIISLSNGTAGTCLAADTAVTGNSSILNAQNNICVGFLIGAVKATVNATMTADHNLYFGNGSVYSGITPGTGDVLADPQFSAWPYNVTLQLTSPAIGAGVSVGALPNNYFGQPRFVPPNIGAY